MKKSELKQLIKEVLLKESPIKYTPYTGGGGPTQKQADNNTKYLANKLSDLNITYIEDREYAKKMWDGNELNLKIKHPKINKTIYVGYDRWGFVIDGLDIDQEDINETIEIIKKWYFK